MEVLPIISGRVAKEMCSDIFVSGRTPEDIAKHETSIFPYNLASYSVNIEDSSVSVSVLGFAKRRAIYRDGLGATLISRISENELRRQSLNIISRTSAYQDSTPFPQGDLIDDKKPKGVDTAVLESAINYAFHEPHNENQRQTRAVIVVYMGKVIAERYADGYSIKSKQLGWSMTKGIINAMIGILVQQGKLNINSPAPIEEWKNDERKKITIANLMHMDSGLQFWWFPAGPSDLTNMLFKEGNMSDFAINNKFTATASKAVNSSKGGKYGALWWTNEADNNNNNKKYINVPSDCFSCQGYDGQFVWVIPSKKLVVVRLSFERGDPLDPNILLSQIIEALPE